MNRKNIAFLLVLVSVFALFEPLGVHAFFQNKPTSAAAEATVRVRPLGPVLPGRDVVLSFELESSGSVNVVCFTLDFNPAVFTYRSSQLGSDKTATANLAVNAEQTAKGKFGLLVDSLGAFEKGTKQVVTAVFSVAKDARPGPNTFSFSATPTQQGVATVDGRMLKADYVAATVDVGERKGAIVGRILDQDLKGSVHAVVVLKSATGEEKTYRTTSFGTFLFDGIADGTYVIHAKSRNYSFAPINVEHKGVFTALEFVEAT